MGPDPASQKIMRIHAYPDPQNTVRKLALFNDNKEQGKYISLETFGITLN